MNRARTSISVGLALLLAACSSGGNGGGSGGSGNGGSQSGGSGGSGDGGSGGSGNGGSQSGGSGGGQGGGSGGSQSGGSGGGQGGGSGGSQNGGSGGGQNGGSGGGNGGAQSGGAGGGAGGKTTGAGGAQSGGTAAGGAQTGGTTGAGGVTSTGGTTVEQPSSVLVTSANNAWWKTGTMTEVTSGTATVTVNDSSAQQKWEGFGGTFNELGWKYLTSAAMQDEAIKLLFSATDGCGFSWGRIPMGASDYAEIRYTLDDPTGKDPVVNGETARPPADTALSKFSLDRDMQKLIPYIKAAQKVKSDIRFWASPWTPPIWMKTGWKTADGGSGTAKRPSYFDGGNYKNDATFLASYAQYYKKFVEGYKEQGINIEVVSPQNEPGYDQNYPSCLWDKTTYVAWVKALGPVMKEINVKVMLGTMSNAGDSNRNDMDIAAAVLADSTAAGFVSMGGAQWGVLEKLNSGAAKFGSLPVWATEHRCGNYPWGPTTGCGDPSDPCPAENKTQAPNDLAYGVESWKYLRNAINKGKVTAYNAWNMVLDRVGLGNDTSREWRQDALLVADGGKVTATPAYYAFRHLAQYVVPGASVVSTSGGDAVAFKNPDGSIVAAIYNSGSANNNFIVKIGGKMFQFAMPGAGWATVKYKP